MSFKDLLATLGTMTEENETLAKSVAATPTPDDKQVAAAAAEAGAMTPEEKEAAEAAAAQAAAAEEGKEGKGAAPMAKSMTVKDAAGNDIEVIDAEEVIKALDSRLGDQEDFLVKSFGPVLNIVKQQGEMIKSLHAQIVKLGGEGRGRRSVFAAVERPAAGAGAAEELRKSQGDNEGMTAEQFFAKADAAFTNKKITGQELTTIDVCRRNNEPIPHDLIKKVALAGA